MTIVVEAYRVACVNAKQDGHTLPTAADVTAILRRWACVTSVVQTREACAHLMLPLADADGVTRPRRDL